MRREMVAVIAYAIAAAALGVLAAVAAGWAALKLLPKEPEGQVTDGWIRHREDW